MKTIVIIGGTGHFGGRICRRLVGEPGTKLVVTSRSQERAENLAAELRMLRPNCDVNAACLDQSSANLASDLNKLHPDIVVHTAGPYQGQGYRVASACIECSSHYVDIADGRAFVLGFDSLDNEAKRRGVLLISGASTMPGLSSCVVNEFRNRFREIHVIQISIAPAHQMPRGHGIIAGVLSYCGKPFQVLSNGKWATMHGWQNLKMQRYPALGRRLSSVCDVPDLSLLPACVPEAKTVTFHAALESKWEQLTLWSMAWLTRLHVVRDWKRLIPLYRRLSAQLINLGSDMGGMQVRLSGIAADRNLLSVSWNLTARQNHGPEIPCTPALIVTRKLARDEFSIRGARPCLNLFSLTEFDEEMRDLDVEWAVSEEKG